jgi:hypothetical protein
MAPLYAHQVKQHYVTESDQSVNRSAGRLVRQPSAAV